MAGTLSWESFARGGQHILRVSNAIGDRWQFRGTWVSHQFVGLSTPIHCLIHLISPLAINEIISIFPLYCIPDAMTFINMADRADGILQAAGDSRRCCRSLILDFLIWIIAICCLEPSEKKNHSRELSRHYGASIRANFEKNCIEKIGFNLISRYLWVFLLFVVVFFSRIAKDTIELNLLATFSWVLCREEATQSAMKLDQVFHNGSVIRSNAFDCSKLSNS